MDEFRLQRSLFRTLRTEHPSMRDGMALVLERLRAGRPGAPWKRCQEEDWEGGLDRWVAWLDALDRAHPAPGDAEVLWFEVPSELNPAYTSVSAYERLGPAGESYGLEEDRIWPQDDEGLTLPEALHDLPELESALQCAGWREPNADREALRPGVYALLYAYVTLLVINGLPRVQLGERLSGGRGVAAVIGWADGDVDPIGQLAARAWGPIRRVRASD